MHKSFVLLALTALAGCSPDFEPKPLPADNPASVEAQEAPRTEMKRLIVTDELSRKTEMQLARKDVPNPDFQDSKMSHDMSKMPGMDLSQMKEMPMPAPSATASPAGKEAGEMKKLSDELKVKPDAAMTDKKTNDKSASAPSSPAAAVYTCLMHPEVNLPAPGKCLKCGMTLVKKEDGAK